jgi:flagellar basal-body rod protein FlgF
MANGIYVATSGAVARIQEMAILAQNLASAKVTGFKRDQVTFEQVMNESRGDAPEDQDKAFVQISEPTTRLDEGHLRATDNPLDVAISGDGFLRVETARGERLTRNGRLMVGKDGVLRTITGLKVLNDEGGEISLPPNKIPHINESGSIKAGDVTIGRLGLVGVDLNGTLKKDESGLFIPPEEIREPKQATVLQGFLEGGNVSAVKMMTELIEVQRNFETLHQVIRAYKDMDNTAVNLPR